MKKWIWSKGRTLKHALKAYKRRLKNNDLKGARDIYDEAKWSAPYAMGQFGTRP